MNIYDVALLIPNANFVPLHLDTLPVVQTQPISQLGYRAPIGTDLLGMCYLTFDGRAGVFTLAY